MYKLLLPLTAMVISVAILIGSCQKETAQTTVKKQKSFTTQELNYCAWCAEQDTTSTECLVNCDYCATNEDTLLPYGVTDNTVDKWDVLYIADNIDNGKDAPKLNTKDLPIGALHIAPSFNPFMNENCEDNHANLTQIGILYWPNIHQWTADPTDIDRSRFLFLVQVLDEGTGEWVSFQNYGGYILPLAEYGANSPLCTGAQTIRTSVKDMVTGYVYQSEQVIWAGWTCDVAPECVTELGAFDATYIDYSLEYNTDVQMPTP